MRIEQVEDILFSTKPSEPLRPIWKALDRYLTERGLERYAKTISASYTDSTGRLVAAAHPDSAKGVVEVAIALSRDTVSERLYDAALLRWRNLPVAFCLSTPADFDKELKDLVDLAIAGEEVEAFDTSDFVSDRDRRIRKGREGWAAD